MITNNEVYDAFVSYNSKDRNLVHKIVQKLYEYGFHLWFDRWSIIPGSQFQPEIEKGLKRSKSMLVFIGESGIGPWEETEFRSMYMDRVEEKNFRIIPVLLPNSASFKDLSPFIRGHRYVDFRNSLDDDEALTELIAGIIGLQPNEIDLNAFAFGLDSRPISKSILGLAKRNTITAYNKIAEKFTEKWFDHPPYDILELLLENIPVKSSILDAGCGPGHHTKYLSKYGHSVIGVDLSEAMLSIAKKKCGDLIFTNMDIQNLEFPKNTFDCVWSAGSTIHIPREELIGLLFGYKRVLKKSGILGLNLQIDRNSEIAEDGRFFEFYENKTEIANILSYVGFNVIADNYGETTRNTHDLPNLTLKWITLFCKIK